MKFYAVKKGRTPGIYRTWDEAKKQVDGFSGAQYKSFDQITDATEYLDWNKETQSEVFQADEDKLQNAVNRIVQNSKKQNQEQNIVSKNKKTISNGKQEIGSYFAHIYTDGGTRNTGVYKGGHVKKTDKAAWAYKIDWKDGEVHEAGGEYGATNNKMEQTAFINSMKKLIELGFNDRKLKFVLDSKYVLDAINQKWIYGWKKRGWKKSTGPLANKEQWQEIYKLLPKFPNSDFTWTKGHAKNAGNEFVDGLLNKYMDEKM